MKPTVVFTRGGGRLGNQLLNYINLLAFSIEYSNVNVIDLAFIQYREEYGNDKMSLANLNDSSLSGMFKYTVEYGWGKQRFSRLFDFELLDMFRTKLLHSLAVVSSNSQSIIGGPPHTKYRIPGSQRNQLDLSKDSTVKTLQSKDVSVLAGWGVRGWQLVGKHRQEIRSRIQPGDSYLSAAESYVSSLRGEYDLLVGVLVRQQDYREWRDGEYFFNSEQYEKFLTAYSDKYHDKEVGFLIASDEEQPEAVFCGEQFNFATGEAVGPNHYLENLAELSICDVILTPPSTFSTVAAFLGNTPLVPLYSDVLDDGWTHLNEALLESLQHPEMNTSVK